MEFNNIYFTDNGSFNKFGHQYNDKKIIFKNENSAKKTIVNVFIKFPASNFK